jgi:hypothetical protein
VHLPTLNGVTNEETSSSLLPSAFLLLQKHSYVLRSVVVTVLRGRNGGLGEPRTTEKPTKTRLAKTGNSEIRSNGVFDFLFASSCIVGSVAGT